VLGKCRKKEKEKKKGKTGNRNQELLGNKYISSVLWLMPV